MNAMATWTESVIRSSGPDIFHLDCTEKTDRPAVINAGPDIARACRVDADVDLSMLDWILRNGLVVTLKTRKLRNMILLRGSVQDQTAMGVSSVDAEDYSIDKVLHRLNKACAPLVARMAHRKRRA